MKQVYQSALVGESTTRPVMIFDMDGTLSNDENRLHHWDAAKASMMIYKNGNDPAQMEAAENRFRSYHGLAIEDLFHEIPLTMLEMAIADERFETWILTARPNTYAGKTCLWLQRSLGCTGDSGTFNPKKMVDRVVMRMAGDNTSSCVIKRQYCLARIPENLRASSMIIDNDPQVTAELGHHMNTFTFKPTLRL